MSQPVTDDVTMSGKMIFLGQADSAALGLAEGGLVDRPPISGWREDPRIVPVQLENRVGARSSGWPALASEGREYLNYDPGEGPVRSGLKMTHLCLARYRVTGVQTVQRAQVAALVLDNGDVLLSDLRAQMTGQALEAVQLDLIRLTEQTKAGAA